MSGAGPSKQTKFSHYQSSVNEPIEEVEDEKEDAAESNSKLITQSIRKRRMASKHIDRNLKLHSR